MKPKLITLGFLFGAMVLSAQTNFVLVFKTNYLTAVPWYREVDGQLYNTRYSLKFQRVIASVESNDDGSLIVGWNTNGAAATNFEKEILLLNYPTNGVTNGEKLNFRALPVDMTNLNGNEIEIWDYGKPHVVETVTSNLVFKP
jgi:hypothetical protein